MEYIDNKDNVSLLSDGNTNGKEMYRLLEQSWERFVDSGKENRQICKEIMHSWVRCRENLVDPYKECDVIVLPNNEFKERYNKAKEMIAAALPIRLSFDGGAGLYLRSYRYRWRYFGDLRRYENAQIC